MNQRWWLWLERAQATVPLLAVAGLAGFSWWLVQSSPKFGGDARSAQTSSSPDFVLDKARVARFNAQGRIEAVLDGAQMRHYADTDRLQIDQLVLSARDDKGTGLKASSLSGEADHKAELVTLNGGARVTALPAADQGLGPRNRPVYFEGEILRIDTRTRVVSSSEPVRLRQQGSEVRGQNLRYDDRTGITDLGGRVHGHYDAP
ncbi:MAG: LPS export ABC transporter periplasmic protein LptC [Aquabacterium sp.]|uniref:LPS export ABC transporter periplasmic protein LptC n=1 Tax=Aquabacterium sp. TaxID=1872578 RepID=UPI0025BECB25|nr:LPS export ABC transporter periplasmic protein LptC [Aquabacterium sp.]MBI5925155.1 LPS export ABC transporter periplasmic protein LptC [Aquabacterium sp.]